MQKEPLCHKDTMSSDALRMSRQRTTIQSSRYMSPSTVSPPISSSPTMGSIPVKPISKNSTRWEANDDETNSTPAHHLGVDRVAKMIEDSIHSFTVQTFKRFQDHYNKLFLFPAHDAMDVEDQDGNWLGYNKYTFDLYGQEPKDLEIRITRHRNKVYVLYGQAWISLHSFLPRLTPLVNVWKQSQHLCPGEKDRLWKDQWLWWQKRGSAFRLLDLPLEIREIIYGFAVVRTIEPWPHGRFRRLMLRHQDTLAARLPNVKLLRTNRQVYLEASHILYRDSTFFVEHRTILRNGLLTKRVMRDRIRKLDLSLTHEEFWKTFGLRSDKEEMNWEAGSAASMLRKAKLTELILTIPMPERVSKLPGLQRSCQKIAVDWILESVWPWVKGHPVTVRGGIKTRQKDEFLEKCAAERSRFLQWCELEPPDHYFEGTLHEYDEWRADDGGVRLEASLPQEGDELEEVVKEVSSLCVCKLPCWEYWTPDD